MSKLRNTDDEEVKMLCQDRFFHQHSQFLQQPTPKMLKNNQHIDAEGKFDNQRYVTIVGKWAGHVFDLQKRNFIEANREQGWRDQIY